MSLPSNPELIRLKNLTVGYEGRILLEDLNLALCAGELVCFMGPNGAGKSTLIRSIGGLQKSLSGEVVLLSGRGIDDKITNEKHVSLVLTDPVRDINMTVREIITFGRYPYIGWNLRLQDRDKELIARAIEQVNIEMLVDRKLHELSDGQLQMAMIARALAQDTPVLILDEPTAHLDLNNRVEIMRLLHRLAREMGKAILVATHELDLALQTADLIWLTGTNRNIIRGIPEDLVLDGSFDHTFAFKGFDLKTGKVQHQAYQKMDIILQGEGHYLLWTKNALERNGYRVSSDGSGYPIQISSSKQVVSWVGGDGKSFNSLSEVLSFLRTLNS